MESASSALRCLTRAKPVACQPPPGRVRTRRERARPDSVESAVAGSSAVRSETAEGAFEDLLACTVPYLGDDAPFSVFWAASEELPKPSLRRRVEPVVFGKRAITLGVLLVLTLFFAVQAAQLKPQAGWLKMVPQAHPYMQTFLEYYKDFGGANTVLVALKHHKGDIYQSEFMETLRTRGRRCPRFSPTETLTLDLSAGHLKMPYELPM